jgi:hypothetical protein
MKWPNDGVFFGSLVRITGDLMNKSGTLISSALLTFGIAAAAMAADMPKAAAPMAADAPAAAAPAADAAKPATHKKKKHKKAAAPAAAK